ncbi:MAG: hypothetical protein NPIRA02_29240 [Nitrospirales bacterium]|nr:MAG: hypothetical protein NPIRA02_29240 [Nitrospirales bacterium]
MMPLQTEHEMLMNKEREMDSKNKRTEERQSVRSAYYPRDVIEQV